MPIYIQRFPTSGTSTNNAFVFHMYNHAKQVATATTWCNNNIFACIIEPTNCTICDKHQLWISYKSRRIFNGKGNGSHSISIGRELDLMDQSINPYLLLPNLWSKVETPILSLWTFQKYLKGFFSFHSIN